MEIVVIIILVVIIFLLIAIKLSYVYVESKIIDKNITEGIDREIVYNITISHNHRKSLVVKTLMVRKHVYDKLNIGDSFYVPE